MTPSLLSRMSIRAKLPLAVGTVLLLFGGALTAAAYLAMRDTVLDRSILRLTSLASQLHQSLQTSLTQTKTRTRTAAERPELLAFLRDPSPANRSATLAAMEYAGPQPELTLAVELRDSRGQPLLVRGRDTATPPVALPDLGDRDQADLTRALPALRFPDSVAIGALRVDGDSILFPIVARVGTTEGFLVQWRRVSNAPQTRDQIARLLGSNAAFYVGNADGSVWSDLGRPTAAPPVLPDTLAGSVARYTRSGGPEVLASGGTLAGTPWAFTLEFPTDAVFAPVALFLRRMMILGLALMLLGTILAVGLSRRLSGPLLHLSNAADAIAAGQLSRRVELTRSDELGRLGASFNTMAAEVETSRQLLQHTVSVRTRELEEALVRLQETQEALVRREKLSVLGQLTSGVGHELRNPLGVMNNAVHILGRLQPDPSPEVLKYLDVLRDQLHRATKIVNDLLGFSRAAPAHRQAVPLRDITEGQLQGMTLPRVRVEHLVDQSLPAVLVDPIHAGQVVHNLITNAVQAMGDPGGVLKLEGQLSGDGYVELVVSDSGPGIPPEHLDKVFEPLFSTKARGIGLGLAVSRTLAQANGGDLTARNLPGGGASFTLQLPVAQAAMPVTRS